jgi:cyclin H
MHMNVQNFKVGSRPSPPITLDEELQLLQFFATNMQALVKELQLPSKVAMSALILLRRFYLSKSVLEADPAKFNLTAIYVACKVCYILYS